MSEPREIVRTARLNDIVAYYAGGYREPVQHVRWRLIPDGQRVEMRLTLALPIAEEEEPDV